MSTLFLSTVLPALLAAAAPDAGPKPEVHQVGSFHGGEVTARDGEEWFGLFLARNGSELRPVRLHVGRVRDVLTDSANQKTGISVSIDGSEKPVVLMKGIPNLRAGPVKTCISKPRFFYPGEHETWQLGDWYGLSAYGNVDRPPDAQVSAQRIYAYRLRLAASPWCEKNKQDVIDVHGLDEDNPPHVIWAGDLDGDQRMDLILSLANHYNVKDWALFLSSFAQGGELVRLVALFRAVGC